MNTVAVYGASGVLVTALVGFALPASFRDEVLIVLAIGFVIAMAGCVWELARDARRWLGDSRP